MDEAYEYKDSEGNIITIAVSAVADGCPSCSSSNIKCKGSFHKCIECGERFETALWLEPEQHPEPKE